MPTYLSIATSDCPRKATSHRNSTLPFSKRHYLSLLFIAIFGTYYQSIVNGGFINLDDMNLMNTLLNEPFHLKDIIFPHVKSYYRPLCELSFWLDHFFWFDSASGWHLTNVLLHAVNTGLVFAIGLVLFTGLSTGKELAAFFSALLYGINPLATEAVCWVSGRSELILGVFTLSSFLCYVIFRRDRSYAALLLSGITYLCASLTKETALVLPALLIAFELLLQKDALEGERKNIFIAAGYFILLTGLYIFVFRRAFFDTSNMRIAMGVSGLKPVSPIENVLVFFASLGYYVKKIFMPYPLNFAIDSIHLYLYGACGVGVVVFYVLRERSLPLLVRFFTAWFLITVAPAIAAAVLHIPWVPWAERYLYLPLAGFSLALGLWFFLFKERYRMVSSIVFVLVVLLFWVTTLHRTYVWADELKLWQDTSQQSDFGPVHYFYGKSLISRHYEPEGIHQMKKAISMGYSYFPYHDLASMALSKGRYDESEEWMKSAIRDYPQRAELHKHLAEIYLRRRTSKAHEKYYVLKAVDEYLKYAAVEKDDASAYLRIAQLYRVLGRKNTAVGFLKRVIEIDKASPAARTALGYLQKSRHPEHVSDSTR